jgi:hypothetical protein
LVEAGGDDTTSTLDATQQSPRRSNAPIATVEVE